MKSWAKKEEARDKHIYVGSVAQSHTGNDWHRDLNSDLLILSPQPSSTSQPLQKTAPAPSEPLQVTHLLGQLLWYAVLESYVGCPVGYRRTGLIPLWQERPSYVWNSNPVTSKSLLLSQTSELTSFRAVVPGKPSFPEAYRKKYWIGSKLQKSKLKLISI